MIARVKESGNLEVSVEENSYDKIAVLDKVLRRFDTYSVYSKYAESMLYLIQNAEINLEIKKYFIKMLSMICNMKSFQVEDYSLYNKEDYKNQMKNAISELNLSMVTDRNYIDIVDMKDSVYINGGYKIYYLSEEFKEKYKGCATFLVENKTNNFEKDLLNVVFDVFERQLEMSKNIKDISISPIINEKNIHIEIAHSYNLLKNSICYLRNSQSFRRNELFPYDKVYLERHISLAESLAKHAIFVESN